MIWDPLRAAVPDPQGLLSLLRQILRGQILRGKGQREP